MVKAFTLEQKERWIATLHKRFSSAAMIIENEAGEVLVVKAGYKKHWTFPGGIIDPGESPLEAAIRETREEVGLQLDASDVQFVSVAHRRSHVADSYQFIFRTTTPYDGMQPIALQATEIEDYAFVSKEEVRSINRNYGKVISHWANGIEGYIEQTFGER